MQAPLLPQRSVTRYAMISTLSPPPPPLPSPSSLSFLHPRRFALLRSSGWSPFPPNGSVKTIEGGETCIYNNGHNFLVLEDLSFWNWRFRCSLRSGRDNLGRVAYLSPLFSILLTCEIRYPLFCLDRPWFISSSRGKEKNLRRASLTQLFNIGKNCKKSTKGGEMFALRSNNGVFYQFFIHGIANCEGSLSGEILVQ